MATTDQAEPPGLRKAVISPMQCELPVQKRVKRSEMAAYLYLLRHAFPPIMFVTDHKPIVMRMEAGRKWCTSGKRAHADLWRQIWHYVDELGGYRPGVVQAMHVKAHRSMAQMELLAGEERAWAFANREVDKLAKRGAELDDGAGMAKPRHMAMEAAKDKIVAAVTYAADLQTRQDKWLDVTPVTKAPARQEQLMVGKPISRPHVLTISNGRSATCSRCGRRAMTTAAVTRLGRSECRGHVIQRSLGVLVDGKVVRARNHHLLVTAGIIWCKWCAGHSAGKRIDKLARRCLRRPANAFAATVLRRLLGERHPATKALLVGGTAPASMEWMQS